MPDQLTIVRRRLRDQRLTGRPSASVAAAVAWSGAVQAQEFAEAVWSVGQRVGAGDATAVETAVDAGEVIRTHLLRPTWHAVAAQDLRWLLRLTGGRVHAVNGTMYRSLELTADVFARTDDLIARAVADGPRTRKVLAAVLSGAGIEASGFRLAYALMHAELEGIVCSGPRQGRQHTYALVDTRVPAGPLDGLTGDGAVDELAARYIRGHGPAGDRDLATWSGLTLTDARAGLARARGVVRGEGPDGTPLWSATRPVPVRPDAPRAFLLPMYDEMIMGFRGLKVVVDGGDPQGRLERAVVVDGATIGSWRRTLTRTRITLDVVLFRVLDADEQDAVRAAADRFGASLGVPAEVSFDPPP